MAQDKAAFRSSQKLGPARRPAPALSASVLSVNGVGLDIGTANIVAARETAKGHEIRHGRNAFLVIREDLATQKLLTKMRITLQKVKDKACIVGKNAIEFSNYFDRPAQRPMPAGVIDPLQREAIHVLNLIVKGILWEPRVPQEACCFSVPGQPIEGRINIPYHGNIIETMLSVSGYKVHSINEGHAVVMAFSIARGGDWIDVQAANALDQSINKVTGIKEKGMSIVWPEGPAEEAIARAYKEYIKFLLEQTALVLQLSDTFAQITEPLDMVFAGGTVMVGGFMEVVQQELASLHLGIPLGNIRKAEDPTHSVAKGCLYSARQ
ncbi:MAG: hypothetical protein HQL19_08015 [Candidatus Omnitrophica bacterium]|nr:hypothetical protein [Candidatus Omnitrophota bacterium]